jgi:hypothetical protein
VKTDCVSANGFGLLKVRVKVALPLLVMLVGENAAVTVGAAALKVASVGHAAAMLPANAGAGVAMPVAVKLTVAVSLYPAESVTVNSRVPDAPFQVTCACGAVAPDSTATPPAALHA